MLCKFILISPEQDSSWEEGGPVQPVRMSGERWTALLKAIFLSSHTLPLWWLSTWSGYRSAFLLNSVTTFLCCCRASSLSS